jgi:GT2 family glycosyltransferase
VSATGTPRVAVVIPTFGRPHLLSRLVGALEDQTLPHADFEVLVVDNGSPGDATQAELARLAAGSPLRLRALRLDENHGPASARNLGWRSTDAPYVAFTDDDCVPRRDWLEHALRTAEATPDLGVLQGATLRPDEPYEYTNNTVYRETVAPSPYFEGSNLLFPRSVLERTGGFDEGYHFGGEDTAAGWAAIEAGGRWVFDELAAVVHDIDERPKRWHLMMAWREGNLVDIAARHPQFRSSALWRPWAHRRSGAAMALGVVGTAVAPWWRPALLAWVPWLVLRHPPLRSGRRGLVTLGHWWLNDAVVLAGMVNGSVRNRTLVL